MDPSDKLAIIMGDYKVPCSTLGIKESTSVLVQAISQLMDVANHASGFNELSEQSAISYLGIRVSEFGLDPSMRYEVEEPVEPDYGLDGM